MSGVNGGSSLRSINVVDLDKTGALAGKAYTGADAAGVGGSVGVGVGIGGGVDGGERRGVNGHGIAGNSVTAASSGKRVQRVFSGPSLIAYDVTPVIDIRGLRQGFYHNVREISHAEVLRVARGDHIPSSSPHIRSLGVNSSGGGGGGGRGGGAAGGDAPGSGGSGAAHRAAHAPTHSLASMRDLHSLHWELAATSPPALTTRRGCVIIALSPLRAVITATRALVFFDDGADNDIGRFMSHLNGAAHSGGGGGGGRGMATIVASLVPPLRLLFLGWGAVTPAVMVL